MEQPPGAGSRSKPSPSQRRPLEEQTVVWQVAAVTLLAAGLRFYHLGAEPFWLDEAITLNVIAHPQAVLWTQPLSDEPPLYYSLQKTWVVFGDSESAVRSLSALMSTVTVPLVYLIGRNLRDHRVGLLSALLFALAPMHIRFAQDARPYALLTAGVGLALAGLTYLMASPARAAIPVVPLALGAHRPAERRSILLTWVAYVLGCTIAIYSHSIAALLLLAANGAALPHWLGTLRRNRTFFWNWIGANAVILALWSWWLPIVWQQFWYAYNGIPEPTLGGTFEMLVSIYGAAYFGRHGLIATAVLAVCALIGIDAAARQARSAALPLMVCAVGVPMATYLISLYRPILLDRTLVWPSIAVLPLIALGIFAAKPRALAAILTAMVLLIAGRGVAGYYADFHKTPWDKIAARVASEPRLRTAILICPAYDRLPLLLYLERLHVSLPVVQLWADDPLGSEAGSWRVAAWNTVDLDPMTERLWLIQSRPCAIGPSEIVTRWKLDGTWKQTRETFRDNTVTLLRRGDARTE